MHKNQVWLAFLAAFTAVVLWFTTTTVLDLYSYFSRDSHVVADQVEWKVTGISGDRYILDAKFRFHFNGTQYERNTAFHQNAYRSPSAAEAMLAKQEDTQWKVWYASGNPLNATLQNHFPLKPTFYLVILWGILLYFVWLGFYVGRFKTQDMPQ